MSLLQLSPAGGFLKLSSAGGLLKINAVTSDGLSAANLDLLEQWLGAKRPSSTPQPRPVIVARLYPYNLSTGKIEELWVADRLYRTDQTAPVGLQHRLALGRLRTSGVEISLMDGGRPSLGFGVTRRRPLWLINPRDRRDGTGIYDKFFKCASYSWAGRPVELWLGPEDDPSFAKFDLIFTGEVRGLPGYDNSGNVGLDLQASLVHPDDELERPRFEGWAYALELDGSTHWIDFGPAGNVAAGDATFGLRFRVKRSDIDGSAAVLFARRDSLTGAGDPGYSCWFQTSGQLRFQISDGANTAAVNLGGLYQFADDRWHVVTYRIDRTAGNLIGRVDGGAEVSASLGSVGSINAPDSRNLTVGSGPGSSSKITGALDHFFLFTKALDGDELAAAEGGPLGGAELGLELYSHFNEDTGSVLGSYAPGPTHDFLDFDGGAAAFVDHGDILDQATGSFTFGQFFRISPTGHAAAKAAIFAKKNGVSNSADPGFAVWLDESGLARASISDGTNGKTTAATGADYADDRWHLLWATVDRDADEMKCYVDGLEIDSADISTVTGSLANAETLRSAAQGSGANRVTGALSASFIFEGVRTVAEVWDKLKLDHFGGTEPGLIFHARYDEGTGTTVANSALVRHGHVFSGAEKVDFGDVLDRSVGDSFTFGQWAKRSAAATANEALFGKKQNVGGANAGWVIYWSSSNQLIARVHDGTNTGAAVMAGAPADDRWHLLWASVDRDEQVLRLYLDGDLVDTEDISAVGDLSNSDQLRSGANGAGGAFMAGSVGHAFVFEGARSPGEVYEVLLRRNLIAEDAGILGGWPFNEGTGTAIADVTGTNNGTSTSSTWESFDGTAGAGATWGNKDAAINGTPNWIATLEGDGSIQGRPKPRGRGPCRGVLAALVDPNGHTYGGSLGYMFRFSSAGVEPWDSSTVLRVYEGGLLATEGVDYDPWDLELGLLVWRGALPENPVTVDFRGRLDDGSYSENRADIVADVLRGEVGLASAQIEPTSLAALEAALPEPVHSWIPWESETSVGAAVGEPLAGRAWWATNLSGSKVRFGVLADPSTQTPTIAFAQKHLSSLSRRASAPVVNEVRLGFERQHHPLESGNSVLGAVVLSELLRQGSAYKFVRAPEGAAKPVQLAHLDAEPFEVLTNLDRKSDAQAEAHELFEILKEPRETLEATPVRKLLQAYIGDYVSVTDPRFGLDAGPSFFVAGVVYVLGEGFPEFRLVLWG